MWDQGFDKAFPIVVGKRDGKLVVVEGHTRLLAAARAGLTEIPVCEKDFESRDGSSAAGLAKEIGISRAHMTHIRKVIKEASESDLAALQKNTPGVTITGVYRKLKKSGEPKEKKPGAALPPAESVSAAEVMKAAILPRSSTGNGPENGLRARCGF